MDQPDTKPHDPTHSQHLLSLFEGRRVADVRDGLDVLGYHHYGSMHPSICPVWPTRVVGIARTVRYLPFEGPAPLDRGEAYAKWSGWYYGNVCTYPWVKTLQPGDLAVIDTSGIDAGLMGSENTLACLRRGCVGFVSDGALRDSDEVIRQQVPFWTSRVSQKMVQARLRFDAMDVPIAVGGVQVRSGDVVLADGDGVIVVPRDAAEDVARLAREEHERDKQGRRRHYEALGRQADETVT
jgi:regulator of RNase E activity RraA